MKKLAAVLFVMLGFALTANAQLKIAYVDSDAIIKTIPEAQQAQQQLDNLTKDWQTELQNMQTEWKKKYEDYESRKLIMSNEIRAKIEGELSKMEQKITEYRQKKFGPKGDYFVKHEGLMKPVHNKIFNVIKEVAEKDNYDYIFDRSSEMLFLYAKDKYDLTNQVIEKLK